MSSAITIGVHSQASVSAARSARTVGSVYQHGHPRVLGDRTERRHRHEHDTAARIASARSLARGCQSPRAGRARSAATSNSAPIGMAIGLEPAERAQRVLAGGDARTPPARAPPGTPPPPARTTGSRSPPPLRPARPREHHHEVHEARREEHTPGCRSCRSIERGARQQRAAARLALARSGRSPRSCRSPCSAANHRNTHAACRSGRRHMSRNATSGAAITATIGNVNSRTRCHAPS